MKFMYIFIVLFSVSRASNAVDFVYRVDSRPPNVIFRDGFSSHGYNLNLQQHIRGDSCAAGSRDSAFIATTTDLNDTYRTARQYYSMSYFTGTLYRYRIRADNNYYHLEPSVQYLESYGVQFSHIERVMMRLQSEVVAMQTVTPYNIIDAVELNFNRYDSTVSDGNSFSNSRYEDRPTGINPGIIPALPTPQSSFRQRINAFGSLLTACFALRGVERSDRNKMIDYDFMPFFDAAPVIKSMIK